MNDEEVCRELSLEIFKKEHGDEKPTLWICGNIKLPNGKETKCQECGVICFYDTKVELNFSKNHKKICGRCALKNHSEGMTKLERLLVIDIIGIKNNE